MQTMDALDLHHKRVLIREDFNVPMEGKHITNAARLESALPTLRLALEKQAKVIVMSHLGRPVEGKFDPAYSLAPIAEYLSEKLSRPVKLFSLDDVPQWQPGDIGLLENVRFLPGEEANAEALSKQLASLGDIFVMDAFAVAHRAQASTSGVAQFAPIACAGPLLCRELAAIEAIQRHPQSPAVAIVGGSKISTKLQLLENLLQKVDTLVVGGGIANTLLAAQGYSVGASLYEPALLSTASALLAQANASGKTIWLPVDVVVAPTLDSAGTVKNVTEIEETDKIFDIGPTARVELGHIVRAAKTILWNGPVGVFEVPAFSQGTASLAKAIGESSAFSVAGGGDTLAAVAQFHVEEKISYLSTGGGAFLEAMEGKILPAVEALMNRRDGVQN